MKEKIRSEYVRRVKKILKSHLNSRNVVTAINSRAVSIIRYSAGIIGWTEKELKDLDRKTRKLMTLHCMFHKKGDVDRLYLKRAEGGRVLISVEDCVLIEKNCLYNYVSESKEKMLKVVKNEGTVDIGKTKEDILESRRENLKRKNLHSVFFKKTEFRDEQTWNWLRKGDLKKATEGTIMSAQEQAIRTRSIRHCIDKENISPLCRLCGERDETVAH